MTEDDAAAHKAVGSVAGGFLEAFEEGFVDLLGAELDDQLVVVDGLDIAMFVDFLQEALVSAD